MGRSSIRVNDVSWLRAGEVINNPAAVSDARKVRSYDLTRHWGTAFNRLHWWTVVQHSRSRTTNQTVCRAWPRYLDCNSGYVRRCNGNRLPYCGCDIHARAVIGPPATSMCPHRCASCWSCCWPRRSRWRRSRRPSRSLVRPKGRPLLESDRPRASGAFARFDAGAVQCSVSPRSKSASCSRFNSARRARSKSSTADRDDTCRKTVRPRAR